MNDLACKVKVFLAVLSALGFLFRLFWGWWVPYHAEQHHRVRRNPDHLLFYDKE